MIKSFIENIIYNYIHTNYVECDECKCLVHRLFSQEVTTFYYAGSGCSTEHFCKGHAKPYDVKQVGYGTLKTRFFRRNVSKDSLIPVNSEGKEIEK